MGNPVVHWEMMSKDAAKTADFYKKIFGWKIVPHPEIGYNIAETGGQGGINGGIYTPDNPVPSMLTMYIAVDELAPFRKKIAAAGGKIVVDEQEVPGMGWLSIFTDLDGRMMGLWKAKMK